MIRKIATGLPESVKTRIELIRSRQTMPQKKLSTLIASIRHSTRPKKQVITHYKYGALKADVTEQFDAHEHQRSTLCMIRTIFDRISVDYVVLPARPTRAPIVVVPENNNARALEAIAGLSTSWRISSLGKAVGRSHPIRQRRSHRYGNGFRVSQTLASVSGDFVSGVENGVDIQFWPSAPKGMARQDGGTYIDGTVLAPLPNAWISYIEPELWHEARMRDDRSVVVRAEQLFDVTEPIDLVYTWVDGDDPSWAKKKALFDPETLGEDLNETAYNVSRFASRDELKYSLRSVEMYAPWVNNIYIVTDGQIPTWLNADNPRIKVVDHKEIFSDPSVLPVFNSHAIESQLHHISGLSERYIYMNDDIFFGRRVSPEHFFHGNGIAKFFMSKAVLDLAPPTARDLPVMSAAKNNRSLIEETFSRTIANKFKHTPHSQIRSVLDDIERAFPAMFTEVSSNRFRSPKDYSITSALHHYYAYAHGKAVPGNIRYFYLDLASPMAERRLIQLLRDRTYDVFCLNDTVSNNIEEVELQSALLENFLPRYFPLRSSFER